MRDVAIIGIGQTKYGEHWKRSLRDLAVEAGLKAVEDANIYAKEIDAIFGGNMAAGTVIGQDHLATIIADFAGLAEHNVPAVKVEAACGSGGAALHMGFMAVASGLYDMVLVGGVEKMTDVPGEHMTDALASAADREWEVTFGATFPSLGAMMARRHMYEYGTTREQLAMFPVVAHENASKNPMAQLRNRITVEKVLNAPVIADPLTLLDCSPITDGAAAVVLAPMEVARKYTDTPVKISASVATTDYISIHSRPSITTVKANVEAGRKAYRMAGVGPGDIDFVELHDAFSIISLIALEDLGFVEKGQGGKFAEEGQIALGGKLPVNPSGGLKAKGHPVGATGVGQVVETVIQLRGEAGERQVDGAKRALTHNVGGTASSVFVHILEVV